MNISDLIAQNLPNELLAQIAGQAGIQDPDQGVHASKSAIQTILQGLSNNSANETGASSLLSALDRDHDGSILNDLAGFLSGTVKPQNHLGKVLNMDLSKIMPLLTMLAPVVMGVLGKARANNQLNTSNVQEVLSGAVNHQVEQNPAYGMFGKLLDQNGDGQILDDIARMGMQFFSKK